MPSYNFNFSESSLIVQSLLLRIDFIGNLLVNLPADSDIRDMYEKEVASLCTLYDKLTPYE